MEDNWKKYVVKHNDKSIKDVITDMIGSNEKLGTGISNVALNQIWRKEMGEMISGYTDRLFFREGRLVVYLTSAPLRQELAMQEARVIEIINDASGLNLIKEIAFR